MAQYTQEDAAVTKRKTATAEALPAINTNLVRVEITCVGLSPLLMNKVDPETLEALRTKKKKSKNAARPETPRDEAEPKVYLTNDGTPYVPTENLLACLIEAGKYVRLDGKRQVSTAKSTTLPGFLSLEDPWLPLFVVKTGEVPAWEVDMRPGRNPNGGEMVCLVRPRFDQWGFKVTALVDLAEITLQLVRDLFDVAGKRVGLCDFRPQRKGPFGRFAIVRWEEKQA